MQRLAVLSRFRSVLLLGVALSFSVAALAPTAAAQRYDFPPKPSGPVLDQGNMLSGGEERALARKLAAYEDTSSTAVVVVTLSSLDGAPVDDYAISLGRDWGVGQEGKDNGVVVLVSKNDRKMFIATGYGVEGALPDAIANRIVERVITPAFRNGDFYAGLDRGTDAIIRATAGEYTATEEAVASSSDDGGVSTTLIYIFLIFAYFVGSSLWRGGGGNKKGAKTSTRRRGDLPIFIWGGGGSHGGGGFGGGGVGGGGGFGGFGGGSFGGGGAGGSW
nr:TPM domain-containing protein [Salinibacter ruber]